MGLKTRYCWEAETQDGCILNAENYKSGDMGMVARFSLIPEEGTFLPCFVLAGVKMKTRFCRGFISQRFNDTKQLPGMQHWEHDSRIIKTETDLRDLVLPGMQIKKRHDGENWWHIISVSKECIVISEPYAGRTKKIESKILLPPPPEEYLHCLVCEGFRVYVKSTDGSVIITPEDYELYL